MIQCLSLPSCHHFILLYFIGHHILHYLFQGRKIDWFKTTSNQRGWALNNNISKENLFNIIPTYGLQFIWQGKCSNLASVHPYWTMILSSIRYSLGFLLITSMLVNIYFCKYLEVSYMTNISSFRIFHVL